MHSHMSLHHFQYRGETELTYSVDEKSVPVCPILVTESFGLQACCWGTLSLLRRIYCTSDSFEQPPVIMVVHKGVMNTVVCNRRGNLSHE